MGFGKDFKSNLYSYFWMPQMPTLFTKLDGNAAWAATQQLFLTTSGEPILDALTGIESGGSAKAYEKGEQMHSVKALNDRPLVDNPALLDQPDPNQGLAPVDAPSQKPAPAPETAPGTAPPKNLRQGSANPETVRNPVVVPIKPQRTSGDDYIDDKLSGGTLGQ
jgi:hypothetical protein